MQLWVTVFSGGSHLHRMCRQSCLKVFFFFVVKWIDCFRAVCLCMCVCVCVCVCVWASESLRCKQDLPLPSNHGRQSAPVCVTATHKFFFHGLLGMVGCHGNWWDVCSLWFFPSFFSIKKEAGCKLTPPTSQTKSDERNWNQSQMG